MTRFVALSVVGLLAACNSPDSPPESPSHQGNTVVIRGGWLFDGIHDARFRNTGIVIREGRLVEVGADLAPARDLIPSLAQFDGIVVIGRPQSPG